MTEATQRTPMPALPALSRGLCFSKTPDLLSLRACLPQWGLMRINQLARTVPPRGHCPPANSPFCRGPSVTGGQSSPPVSAACIVASRHIHFGSEASHGGSYEGPTDDTLCPPEGITKDSFWVNATTLWSDSLSLPRACVS